MTIYRGQVGSVTMSNNLIADVSDWSLETAQEFISPKVLIGVPSTTSIDYTADHAYWERPAFGRSTWTGTVNCFWDGRDTAQNAIQPGDTGVIRFYYYYAAMLTVSGNSGNIALSGSIAVEDYTVTAQMDQLITLSVSFRGTGALTISVN